MAGSTRIPFSRSRSRRSPGCRSRRGRAGASRSTRTRSWFQAASSRARPSRGATAEGGVSFVGPSFSRIYDTSIGLVGQVQAHHRAARGLSVRLGRRQSGPYPRLRRGRQRSRPEPDPLCDRQPPARAHRGRQGLGRGDRLARDRADLRLRFSADARAHAADVRAAEDRALRGAPPDLAAGPPPRRRPAGLRPLRQPAHDRERHGRRDLGLQLRQRELVRRAAGRRQPDSRIQLQLRPAPRFGRGRPRQVLPLRRARWPTTRRRTRGRRTGAS